MSDDEKIVEEISYEWRVSDFGDIRIVRIIDRGGTCQLEDTLFHIPAEALRCALANINGNNGYGSQGKIKDYG